MTSRNQLVATITICAALLVGAGHAAAGDLIPPTGQVAPTNRVTIYPQAIAALPYNITQPGSYVLMGDIDLALIGGGTQGIVITADHVTLDLNGFSLIGQAASADGVLVSGAHANIRILNGTVRGWAGDGVDAVAATHSIFEKLRLRGNSGNGLITGANCTVRECVSTGNTGVGISASNHCLVERCVCNGNTAGHGINVNTGCEVIGCIANDNGASGVNLAGINAVESCNIIDCTTYSNASTAMAGHGIIINSRCRVSGCTVTLNRIDGIRIIGATNHVVGNNSSLNGSGGTGSGINVVGAGGGNVLDSNMANSNDVGITVGSATNTIIRNSVKFNPTGYSIVGGNDTGPIGTAAASTSPWANLQ